MATPPPELSLALRTNLAMVHATLGRAPRGTRASPSRDARAACGACVLPGTSSEFRRNSGPARPSGAAGRAPDSQFAAMSLETFGNVVAATPALRAQLEKLVAANVPPPPPPLPPPPPPGRKPRVALVCPGNIFFFDSDTVARNTSYNWSTRATGGLVATHALIRCLASFCELDVLALDDLPARRALYGETPKPTRDAWGGVAVVRAPKVAFGEALDALWRKNADVATAKSYRAAERRSRSLRSGFATYFKRRGPTLQE